MRLRSAVAPAVSALVEALQDSEDDVRLRVTMALGQIGPAAKEAIPALIALVKNANIEIRVAAMNALELIDSEAAIRARNQ